MHPRILLPIRALLLLAAALMIAAAVPARAAVLHYNCLLSGPAESPPNASPGTGGAEVYEPRFTVHGYRYVELTGLPAGFTPTADTVTGRAAWLTRIRSQRRWKVVVELADMFRPGTPRGSRLVASSRTPAVRTNNQVGPPLSN